MGEQILTRVLLVGIIGSTVFGIRETDLEERGDSAQVVKMSGEEVAEDQRKYCPESYWTDDCAMANTLVKSMKVEGKVPWCSKEDKCKDCRQCNDPSTVEASAKKPKQPERRSSLVDLATTEEEEVAEKQCGVTNSWRLPLKEVFVGQGAHGTIVQIAPPQGWEPQSGKRYAGYAIKRGKNKGDKEDIKKERAIMAQANQICKGFGVMEVSEPEPCIYDHTGKGLRKSKSAMISPLMAGGDLQKWSDNHWRSVGDKAFCAERIAIQLIQGLQCLHHANYIHGDMKPDNVFFGGPDRAGCPADVRVADFGLSTPITEEGNHHFESLYPSKYLWISGHLSESMFESGNQYHSDGGGDSLGFMRSAHGYRAKTHYRSHPAIDWCSLIYMMHSSFGMTPADLFFYVERVAEKANDAGLKFWQVHNNGVKDLSAYGACGLYGNDREQVIPF